MQVQALPITINKNDTAKNVIQIKGLHKKFGEHEVLKGINLTIKKGENVVVLGKSGTGKSVLIKCIIGLETIDEGEIMVLDQNISSISGKELNKVRIKMGFLFQSAALYDSMTVRQNLDFPLQRSSKHLSAKEREDMIIEELHDVGLSDAIDKMPSELSGGMRKRIGLARTLILKPEIMLYDEPTTGLDTITSKEISELILAVQQKNKTSSIIITHDMACAKLTADRIVILKDGVVVAEGTYEALENSQDEWVRSFFN
ncbi:MAG TPA: ATP-binding cassette domain-containing protein [Ferruginibacter sp.]|jgi:phospholipid/cholesterol/gamma-HCH transport system ATP-binding protein|nr:ATP-binding cassette domain-containing protein [Ferruginibacter sp.]